MVEFRDFRVEITDEQIDDLRSRLRNTRWPEAETVDDWSQGIPLSYTRELAEYWADDYDMRRLETRLNAYPQFHAQIDELGIHFLHIRSKHENARPMIMTHGWPGSVVEFLNVIEPLTDPEKHGGTPSDAFHLVVPSLPGFAFSDKPSRHGTDLARIGRAWHDLMLALGYPRYYAQGGDWGSFVTATMAATAPEGLLGVHVNMVILDPSALAGQLGEPTAEEQALLAHGARYWVDGNGYSQQQATRPQTIGYPLADSATGQLAWIAEKFQAWTDCGEGEAHPEKAVTRDELLDNIMTYWLTNSAASSARMYWECFTQIAPEPVHIPAAYSRFPKEIFGFTERQARTRFSDLRYYNATDRGGHFAAFEQPELFVREIRAGIAALEA
jgi:pimeloyl-ACP methyl ester carboxylesterase